jgi:hypothetical protein
MNNTNKFTNQGSTPMFGYFNLFFAIVFFLVGLGSFGYGYYATFHVINQFEGELSWFERYFILMLSWGMALYMFWTAWDFWKEAKSEAKLNSKWWSKASSPDEHPSPPIPEDYPETIRDILAKLGKFGITLRGADGPAEDVEKLENAFADALWQDICHQAKWKHGGSKKLSAEDVPPTTPYDVLFLMTENLSDHPYSKNIMSLSWDVEEDVDYYKNYAIQLRDLSQGDLPLENVEDILLNGNDLRYRELRFTCCGKDHAWPFEVEGKSLNYALLQRLGELMRQNSSGYRFAIFGDGEVVRLRQDQLDSFSQLIEFPVEWMDLGDQGATTA